MRLVYEARLPVVDGCTNWSQIAAMSRNAIVALSNESALPTVAELRMLRSFCEFKVRCYYREEWADRLLGDAFACDEGAVTNIFLKGGYWPCNGADGWCYRLATWTQGPMFMPSLHDFGSLGGKPPRYAKPLTLLELLDERVTSGRHDRWAMWKALHTEAFPGAAAPEAA